MIKKSFDLNFKISQGRPDLVQRMRTMTKMRRQRAIPMDGRTSRIPKMKRPIRIPIKKKMTNLRKTKKERRKKKMEAMRNQMTRKAILMIQMKKMMVMRADHRMKKVLSGRAFNARSPNATRKSESGSSEILSGCRRKRKAQ